MGDSDSQDPLSPRLLAQHLSLLEQHCSEPLDHDSPDLGPLLLLLDLLRDSPTPRIFLNSHSDPPQPEPEIQIWRVIVSLWDSRIGQSLLLWAKWISVPAVQPRSVLNDPVYWQRLQDSLKGQSSAQKLALHILERSIQLLDDDVDGPTLHYVASRRTEYVDAYSAYCRLFEIIVIGRYINQVQVCINSWANSCPQKALTLDHPVHSTWWNALFAAALSQPNAGIQQLIGRWLLGNYLMTTYAESYASLVTQALLPWAARGPLLSKTLRRGRNVSDNNDRLLLRFGTVTSDHGEQLLWFCTQLTSGDARSKLQYAKAVLRYFVDHPCHAAVWAFIGLDCGVPGWTLDVEALRLIQKLALALTGVRRAIVLHRLFEICNDEPPVTSPAWRAVARFQADWRATHVRLHADEVDAWLGISPGPTAIREGKWGELMSSVELAMRHPSQDTITLAWGLASDLNYPLTVMQSFPDILLHRNAIDLVEKELAIKQSVFATFLADMCLQLYNIGQSKPCIWNRLAAAARNAFVPAPHLIWILLDNLIVQFANEPPRASPDFLLDVSLIYTIGRFVSANEAYGNACFFDLLNVKGVGLPYPEFNSQRTLQKLFDPWLAQRVPAPMVTAWKRSTQLQVMALLVRSQSSNTFDQWQQLYTNFMRLLALEPSPPLRSILEWIISSISLHSRLNFQPEFMADMLRRLQDPEDSNPKFVASIIRLASRFIIHSKKAAFREFCTAVLIATVPLCTHPKVVIRHDAQRCFPLVYKCAEEAEWPVAENPALSALDHFIRQLDALRNPPASSKFEALGVFQPLDLTSLFMGEHFGPEGALLVADFGLLFSDEMHFERNVPFGDGFWSAPKLSMPPPSRPGSAGFTGDSAPDSLARGPLQTKAVSHPDHLNDKMAPVQLDPNHSAPILIASLVEMAVNLGGLSRIADIFGAFEMHVHDKVALKTAEFQSVSVASDKHVSVVETKKENIAAYLRRLKQDGWTVVGVEQTDTSLVLGNDHSLPKRAAIVMGAERTGIPGGILAECDVCFEIRQWGVSRSLNVQTAAGIVMHEWRRIWGDGA